MMRLSLLPPALIAMLALSACVSAGSGGPNNDPEFDGNCAEQSALATLGTTEGNQITITCP